MSNESNLKHFITINQIQHQLYLSENIVVLLLLSLLLLFLLNKSLTQSARL